MNDVPNVGPASQHRLLAIDGGGVRGIVALEILAEIESQLRDRFNKPSLVLSDYFDYIAGTSTGGIIAAMLSMGKSVDDVQALYRDSAKAMFKPASFRKRLRHRYDSWKLAQKFKSEFGEATTLGSEKLKSLLMLVMRNATTDSPWPVSSNPHAIYNDRSLPDCNLNLPLWQLVRASTAAPTFFPPEEIWLGDKKHLFVDGAITPYNNPAFQLFLMATLKPYRLEWPTGEKEMLLVSVGTGTHPNIVAGLEPRSMSLLFSLMTIPSVLIGAAMSQQDLLCRTFGKCLSGDPLDSELGDLLGDTSFAGREKHFTYMRYDVELTKKGVESINVEVERKSVIHRLDAVAHIEKLSEIGKKIAKLKVRPQHFDGFGLRDVAR